MKLATFNVLSGRSVRDGLIDLDRFCAALATLDADVVALQEVDRGQPRSGGADLAALAAQALGASAWRFAPAIVGTPGGHWTPASDDSPPDAPGYGVALLSRHPVTCWQVLRLAPLPVKLPLLIPGPQRIALVREEPRVALVGTVQTPAGPVTVASTHLAFVPGWNVRQLDRIRKALQDVPGPVVIAGDLNLPLVRLRGWHRLAAAGTYPAARPRLQLDHLLARGPIRPAGPAQVRALPVSDHAALSVPVTLSPG